MPVDFVVVTIINGREMLGDLLVAYACIGRPQFVEAFEVVLMENLSCGANDSLLEIAAAFVRRKQVTATVWRQLFGVLERFANMVIHRDPARRGSAAAATLGAVLDIDLAELFGFTV